jgi:hypothetical protein
LAQALENAAADYGAAGELEQVHRIKAELRMLSTQYPDAPEIAAILARLEHRSE